MLFGSEVFRYTCLIAHTHVLASILGVEVVVVVVVVVLVVVVVAAGVVVVVVVLVVVVVSVYYALGFTEISSTESQKVLCVLFMLRVLPLFQGLVEVMHCPD